VLVDPPRELRDSPDFHAEIAAVMKVKIGPIMHVRLLAGTHAVEPIIAITMEESGTRKPLSNSSAAQYSPADAQLRESA
jgi:hypothetical protein